MNGLLWLKFILSPGVSLDIFATYVKLTHKRVDYIYMCVCIYICVCVFCDIWRDLMVILDDVICKGHSKLLIIRGHS